MCDWPLHKGVAIISRFFRVTHGGFSRFATYMRRCVIPIYEPTGPCWLNIDRVPYQAFRRVTFWSSGYLSSPRKSVYFRSLIAAVFPPGAITVLPDHLCRKFF